MGFDYRTYTGLGKQTFGGHKQNLVGTRIQEKGAVTPQETDPDLAVNVQQSLVEVWLALASCRVGDIECSSVCMGSSEGGHHYPYHISASGQTIGREHSPTHQQKIGLKIY